MCVNSTNWNMYTWIPTYFEYNIIIIIIIIKKSPTFKSIVLYVVYVLKYLNNVKDIPLFTFHFMFKKHTIEIGPFHGDAMEHQNTRKYQFNRLPLTVGDKCYKKLLTNTIYR